MLWGRFTPIFRHRRLPDSGVIIVLGRSRPDRLGVEFIQKFCVIAEDWWWVHRFARGWTLAVRVWYNVIVFLHLKRLQKGGVARSLSSVRTSSLLPKFYFHFIRLHMRARSDFVLFFSDDGRSAVKSLLISVNLICSFISSSFTSFRTAIKYISLSQFVAITDNMKSSGFAVKHFPIACLTSIFT